MAEGKRMPDEELALELIRRLNKLCENELVRKMVAEVIDSRVPCPPALVDHSTIQVVEEENTVGFLGILNGLVGVDAYNLGYIAAVYDSNGNLMRFDDARRVGITRVT